MQERKRERKIANETVCVRANDFVQQNERQNEREIIAENMSKRIKGTNREKERKREKDRDREREGKGERERERTLSRGIERKGKNERVLE